MDQASWMIEAAKQVPALAVLGTIVVYFFKHLAELRAETEKRMAFLSSESEKRIIQLMENHARDIKEVADREAELIRSITAVVATNNQALGSVSTLLQLAQREQNGGSSRHNSGS